MSWNWGLYDQNAIKRVDTFTILSVAYQWLGEKTKVIACDTQSEKQLLQKLHKLLDEAEIVIAHNGDAFDIKKINARFIIHKMKPPSPYLTIDTKKEAKKIAAFDSNSLNNLGIDLSEGEKIKHRGFEMWEGCMSGNKKDWRDMKLYNKKDVDLLARIYLRLRGWMKNPKTTNQDRKSCGACGSNHSQKHGIIKTKISTFDRYQCMDCGSWFRGEKIK